MKGIDGIHDQTEGIGQKSCKAGSRNQVKYLACRINEFLKGSVEGAGNGKICQGSEKNDK